MGKGRKGKANIPEYLSLSGSGEIKGPVCLGNG